MTNLIEIETAIKQLPKDEIRQLAQWLNEYLDDDWDREMENDLLEGNLDHLIAKAEMDIINNRIYKLNLNKNVKKRYYPN